MDLHKTLSSFDFRESIDLSKENNEMRVKLKKAKNENNNIMFNSCSLKTLRIKNIENACHVLKATAIQLQCKKHSKTTQWTFF